MTITITPEGTEAILASARWGQTPDQVEGVLDDAYQRVVCPTHGRTVKHSVDATKRVATVTYCCPDLRELVHAARDQLSGDEAVLEKAREVTVEDDDIPAPQDPGESSTPAT